MPADRLSKSEREETLDGALEDSFPASDPVSVANPTTTGTKGTKPKGTPSPEEELDRRIHERADELWRSAGSPRGSIDRFIDKARTLIAIEDDPKAGTLPNPMSQRDLFGPEGEPIEPTEEVENVGEFPTLTDQGEQTYPPRRPRELASGKSPA
jgi:hypothetical protein